MDKRNSHFFFIVFEFNILQTNLFSVINDVLEKSITPFWNLSSDLTTFKTFSFNISRNSNKTKWLACDFCQNSQKQMVQKRLLIHLELFKEQWLSVGTAIVFNQTVFLQNNTVFPIPYVPNDSFIPGFYCFGISLMVEFIDVKMQSTKAAFVAKEERNLLTAQEVGRPGGKHLFDEV